MTVASALYRPTASFTEGLDPRAKITFGVLLAVSAVVAGPVWLKAVVVLTGVVFWLVARLPLRALALTFASLSIFIVGTLLLNAVIAPPVGAPRTYIGPVSMSPVGLVVGLRMSLQIIGVILSLALLVRSTSPVILAEGAERMFRPLARIGVPTHEAVMMFSITLRFIPILAQEFTRLQIAQISRGGGAHRRGLRARAASIVPILLPLLIATIVRAKDIAEAMEARGYRGSVGRSEIRDYRLRRADWSLMALGVALLVVASCAPR